MVAGGIGFGQALANASALVRILRPKIEELALQAQGESIFAFSEYPASTSPCGSVFCLVAGGIGFGQALANASALVRILRPKIEELALQAQGESIFEEYPASPSPCGSVFCLVAGGIGFGQALANASALVRILRPKIEELARKYIISLAIYLFLLHISL